MIKTVIVTAVLTLWISVMTIHYTEPYLNVLILCLHSKAISMKKLENSGYVNSAQHMEDDAAFRNHAKKVGQWLVDDPKLDAETIVVNLMDKITNKEITSLGQYRKYMEHVKSSSKL